MSKEKKQTRIELLVESIAVEKQVLVEFCDDLAAARDQLDNKAVKEATKKLEPQIKRYNGLVAEYNKLTGEKAEGVSANLASEIAAGSNNYNVAPIGTPTVITASAYNPNVSVLNQKELQNYLNKSNKALENVKSRLATTAAQKDQANGYNKVLLIINCLTYQILVR